MLQIGGRATKVNIELRRHPDLQVRTVEPPFLQLQSTNPTDPRKQLECGFTHAFQLTYICIPQLHNSYLAEAHPKRLEHGGENQPWRNMGLRALFKGSPAVQILFEAI